MADLAPRVPQVEAIIFNFAMLLNYLSHGHCGLWLAWVVVDMASPDGCRPVSKPKLRAPNAPNGASANGADSNQVSPSAAAPCAISLL